MTAADNRCECCGHTDLPAGVASSGLGAASFFWCQICLLLGAEPKWVIEGFFGEIPTTNIVEGFLYYEPEDDTYRDPRTGEIVMIPLVDGTEVKTRSEMIQKAQANHE